MNLPELVNEINILADELFEAQQLRGQSAVAGTASALNRACGLLRKVCDPNDAQFQGELTAVAMAIKGVTPATIPSFHRSSDWDKAVGALGNVATAVGLSDRSVTQLLRAFDACRPPAQPSPVDLLVRLADCRDAVCNQASNFHGEMSLIQSAVRHERERQEHRRIGGVVATAAVVGLGIVTAPLVAVMAGGELILAGWFAVLGVAGDKAIHPAIHSFEDPENTIAITKDEFIIGTTRIPRH
jgi:hypothetical protein